MQEAESIQYRTNRSGLVRSQPIKIPRFDKNVKKAIWKSKYATIVCDEEAEETQSTGMIYTVINFVTNLFWRS